MFRLWSSEKIPIQNSTELTQGSYVSAWFGRFETFAEFMRVRLKVRDAGGKNVNLVC